MTESTQVIYELCQFQQNSIGLKRRIFNFYISKGIVRKIKQLGRKFFCEQHKKLLYSNLNQSNISNVDNHFTILKGLLKQIQFYQANFLTLLIIVLKVIREKRKLKRRITFWAQNIVPLKKPNRLQIARIMCIQKIKRFQNYLKITRLRQNQIVLLIQAGFHRKNSQACSQNNKQVFQLLNFSEEDQEVQNDCPRMFNKAAESFENSALSITSVIKQPINRDPQYFRELISQKKFQSSQYIHFQNNKISLIQQRL